MKDEMSGVDVHFLVRELQSLVGARVQKVYGVGRDYYFQVHQAGEGKRLLKVSLPGLCYLVSEKPEFPKLPSGFVTFLRKRVTGARIKAIVQYKLDRTIIVELVRGQEGEVSYRLVIELIAPGNLLLLGHKTLKGGGLSDELILGLAKPAVYKDRTLRGGVSYEAPPGSVDVLGASDEALVRRVAECGMDSLVKALAVGLGVGGEYAELACRRAGLEKNKQDFGRDDILKGLGAVRSLLEEEPRPLVVDARIILFPEDEEGVRCKSVSEALETLHASVAMKAPSKKKKKKSIVEAQLEQKKTFEKTIEESQRRGELVYEHYQELQAALEAIKKGEEPSSEHFRGYNKKTREAEFEFP